MTHTYQHSHCLTLLICISHNMTHTYQHSHCLTLLICISHNMTHTYQHSHCLTLVICISHNMTHTYQHSHCLTLLICISHIFSGGNDNSLLMKHIIKINYTSLLGQVGLEPPPLSKTKLPTHQSKLPKYRHLTFKIY